MNRALCKGFPSVKRKVKEADSAWHVHRPGWEEDQGGQVSNE